MIPAQREERARFNEQLRSRIRLIAQERGVPATELKWIGRLKHEDLVQFAQRYRVSYDWLLCGDLRGLLRTARARRGIYSAN
jgi:hypothetical protein